MQLNNAQNGAKFVTKKLQKDFLKVTRGQARYRQFASWYINQGMQKGHQATWNIPRPLGLTPPIVEGATVPTEDVLVDTGEVTAQMYIKGVPFTKKLAMVTEQDIKSMIEDQLAVNLAKNIENSGAAPAYRNTNIKVTPAASGASATDIVITDTTAGTFTGVNNAAMTIDHVLNISVEMQEKDVETREGLLYCVGRPRTFFTFRKQLEEISQYTAEGFANIVAGKTGQYDNIVFVTQTDVASRGWTNGKSDEAFFFGATSIVESIIEQEKVIANNSTNWGQDLGLGYEFLAGHALIRNDKVFHWASAS